MKKFLSFLLAFVFVFSMLLPLQASAAENDIMNQKQLIELAKEVFPEYAKKLNGNGSARHSEAQAITSEIYPVIQETRTVDDSTTITYTEHNNGIITLAAARFQTNVDIEDEEPSIDYDSYMGYTVKLVASVIEGPTFTSSNVKYRIYRSSYDIIASAGNYGIPGYSSSQISVSMYSHETATRAASVTYSFPCIVGGYNYSGEVFFSVQNDTAQLTFDIW